MISAAVDPDRSQKNSIGIDINEMESCGDLQTEPIADEPIDIELLNRLKPYLKIGKMSVSQKGTEGTSNAAIPTGTNHNALRFIMLITNQIKK